MPLHELVLLVSGRVSLEIVQKAAVAGIPIVCAVSAPSDLAVEAAERFGQTLVGFLRGDGFNVYARRGADPALRRGRPVGVRPAAGSTGRGQVSGRPSPRRSTSAASARRRRHQRACGADV